MKYIERLGRIQIIKQAIMACVLVCFVNISIAENPSTNLDVVHASNANRGYEPELLAVLSSLKDGQLEHALERVDAHLKAFPTSRVGYLLRADILKAMAGPLEGVGSSEMLTPERVKELTHQLRNRMGHATPQDGDPHTLYPSSLIDLGKHQFVLVADMSAGRLYLFENDQGHPRLARDYYMSVGSAGFGKELEGDNKTPVGVYQINRYIEGKALPDLYGKGAFPVNYPNRYDRYRKRTGYGIWLHGTPSDTYARAPWSSEGCFVLSNDDLLDVGQYLSVENRTPVILSDKIEWINGSELAARREIYTAIIDQWKADWEAIDTDASISHYQQQDFNFGSADYAQWAARKRAVNRSKTFIQLDTDILSLFAYPGEDDMFIVQYLQRYLSNNFASESIKEQYWRRAADGKWRIIYEGAAG